MSTANKCVYTHTDANGAKLEIGDAVLVRTGTAKGAIYSGIVQKFTRTGITVVCDTPSNTFTENRKPSQVLKGVRIQHERLNFLERSELKLSLLFAHGVDSWEGYDEAMAEYNELVKEVAE